MKIKFTPELQLLGLCIIGIVFLETLALLVKVDGAMFASSMTAVGALGGWIVKSIHEKRKKVK